MNEVDMAVSLEEPGPLCLRLVAMLSGRKISSDFLAPVESVVATCHGTTSTFSLELVWSDIADRGGERESDPRLESGSTVAASRGVVNVVASSGFNCLCTTLWELARPASLSVPVRNEINSLG